MGFRVRVQEFRVGDLGFIRGFIGFRVWSRVQGSEFQLFSVLVGCTFLR